MLGPLSVYFSQELHLTATERGLVIATPILAGAAYRLIWGVLVDRMGPKRAGLLGLSLTFLPLVFGCYGGNSFSNMILMGILLGIPGASFAVSLPMVSQWYPPRYQGIAMGIAGAGNSGTVLAALLLPRLAEKYNWHVAMALMMIPLAGMFLIFLFCAKDCPAHRGPPLKWRDYTAIFKQLDTLWFCFFYSITFGGFVGLAALLAPFFCDQYGVTRVRAGELTALCACAGSFMRPVGGMIADKFSGLRVLPFIYFLAGILLLLLSTLPGVHVSTILFFFTLAVLGAGNGAVFQLVAQRFKTHLGLITGLVGAAGGLGGFFLPTLLGGLKDVTGSYAGGLLVSGIGCFWALSLVLAVQNGWRLTWAAKEKAAAAN